MNKIILPTLAVLFTIIFSSCGQRSVTQKSKFNKNKTVMLHWLNLDDKGLVRLSDSDSNYTKLHKPFSGEAIETFEQSPTKSVSGWLDGRKHGTTTEYFYNGRIRRIINYKHGEKNGLAEEFRITGELLRRENYMNGKLNGSKSDWHPNGTKIFEVEMRDGKPHGQALEWYPDGLEKSSTVYRHGRREGPSSEWYPNGQRKIGLFYQKDKQHGLRTVWYEDGQKRLTAIFDNDMMEGKSQGWFPNGQIQFDYNFKENLEHGICTEWDSNGKKISEIRFIDGKATQDLLTGQKIATPAVESNAKVTPTIEPVVEKKTEIIPEKIQAVQSKEDIPTSSASDNLKSVPEKKVDIKEVIPPPPAPTFDPFSSESNPASNSLKESNKEPLDTDNKKDNTFPPPPPPSFDPFATESPSADPFSDIQKKDSVKEEDSNSINESSEIPSPPPPPPPSFNPFETEVLDSPKIENEPQLPTIPPPPPPPAPTTNPFEIESGNKPASPNTDKEGLNPFESLSDVKESNSTVPLGDVFGTPPSINPNATEDENINLLPPPPPPPPTFNPFDLPPPPQ